VGRVTNWRDKLRSFSLCLKGKTSKIWIFAPQIALRLQRSDTARNPYFPADFSNFRFKCSQPLRKCGNIKPLYGRDRGERWLDIAQTIGPNCSMTHSPGKIEYNCRYFIMTFRTQIHKKKFGKKCFRNLQGTLYRVLPPIDQYLKFKNRCSLLATHL